MRINKYLAEKGLASRREADRLIQAGKVLVNGQKAVLGQQVSEADDVKIRRSVRIQMEKGRQYLVFYKPKGIVTVNATDDEQEIKDIIKLDKGVVPIGRLDKNSSGLILLTNDGRVAKKLISPDANQEKEYRVSVNKNVRPSIIDKLKEGIVLEDGYKTKPANAKKVADKTIALAIKEGKRHQIRRMLAVLGYEVRSLKRVRLANLTLEDLKPGEVKPLSGEMKKDFLALLGIGS